MNELARAAHRVVAAFAACAQGYAAALAPVGAILAGRFPVAPQPARRLVPVPVLVPAARPQERLTRAHLRQIHAALPAQRAHRRRGLN